MLSHYSTTSLINKLPQKSPDVTFHHKLPGSCITTTTAQEKAVYNAKCWCPQRGGGRSNSDTCGMGRKMGLFCVHPLWTTQNESTGRRTHELVCGTRLTYIMIVIFKVLEHHSKAKRRAPAYS